MRLSNPDEVLNSIAQARGIPIEELKRAYDEIYKSPFVQTDPSFLSDEDRIHYVLSVMWTRYMLRPPVKEVEIVPIGVSAPRYTKAGELMANLYVLTPSSKSPVRLVLRGKEMVERRKGIAFGAKYRVKAGQLSSGDLMADERTVFDDPEGLEISLQQILDGLNIPKVPDLASLPKHLSRLEGGYVDDSDWRRVSGIILRANKGQRKDGSTFCVFTIADTSIVPSEKFAGITVWVDETQFTYGVEDEIEVYGTVQQKQDGECFLNGYLVLPKHVRR